MAKYQTSLKLSGAYGVDAALLQDITARAKAFLDSDLKILIKFSDVHELQSENLDEVLQDSLVRSDVITAISVEGDNYRVDPTRSFRFKAYNESFLPAFLVDIHGSQEPCRSLSNHIEGLLRAKRQWYSPIIPSDSFIPMATSFAVVFMVLAIPAAVAFMFSPPSFEWVVRIEVAGIVFWFTLLAWFRKILFPQLIVEIGRSSEIATRARGLRNWLFGSVILAFIIAVVAELTAAALSR